MRNRRALLIGSIIASACTSSDEAPGSVDLSERNGVTVVDNREPKWDDGEGWSVSLEPHVSIGVVDGPAEYQLFDVTAAARQSDGDIVVVDGGSREVRLYDRLGIFMRNLGGPGSGPGEFQDPAQVMVTAGDSVVVWDNTLYRITRFDPDGGFVSVQSIDRGKITKAIDPPLYPGPAKVLGDDRILVRLVEKTGKNSPPGAFRTRSGALRVAADHADIDTLMFFGDVEQVTVRAPWGQWPMVPPCAKTTLTAVHATLDRVCIGTQEGPEVTCFGPDATPTLIRWTSEASQVTKQQVDSWRDTTVGLYTLKMSEAEASRVLDQVTVPEACPHYSRLVLDWVGNLWAERTPPHAAALVDYTVFDPTGELLGVVTLPPIEVLEIGDNYVMGVFRDALEVEYLQVYEIAK
jgi:hypothetical protein